MYHEEQSYRIGRKKAMFGSVLGAGAMGIGCAFATSYVMFVVLRFFVGAFAIACFTCGFVMGEINIFNDLNDNCLFFFEISSVKRILVPKCPTKQNASKHERRCN